MQVKKQLGGRTWNNKKPFHNWKRSKSELYIIVTLLRNTLYNPEYITRQRGNARLGDSQAGICRNINSLRYVDGTAIMTESKRPLLMR